MIIAIITLAALLLISVFAFYNTKRNDAAEIKMLIDAGVMKDASIKSGDERLKEVMKKMVAVENNNKQLFEMNLKLQTVVNMLLTVAPRYVLKAFADKKLTELVQKEMLVQKKELFELDQSIIADRSPVVG